MEKTTKKTKTINPDYNDFRNYVDMLYYPGWCDQMGENNPEALQFEYEHWLSLMNF